MRMGIRHTNPKDAFSSCQAIPVRTAMHKLAAVSEPTSGGGKQYGLASRKPPAGNRALRLPAFDTCGNSTHNPKEHTMPHYRIRWKGPYDGPNARVRILTMQATDKEQAAELHDKLFPVKERKIVLFRATKR